MVKIIFDESNRVATKMPTSSKCSMNVQGLCEKKFTDMMLNIFVQETLGLVRGKPKIHDDIYLDETQYRKCFGANNLKPNTITKTKTVKKKRKKEKGNWFALLRSPVTCIEGGTCSL